MAIKQAQYKITLQSGEDIYHFQTDDKMVKIVNDSGQVLGTFKEYGMEGKVITSGSFKGLKITGIYKIKGVSGLPAGYDTGKISILSVKAVGKAGAPELVSYDLISQNGEIYHNTVIGSKEIGWTAGGANLKNTIDTITSEIGKVSGLKTKSKANLVNAVNELKVDADSLLGNFNKLDKDYEEFKGHNHDNRYIKKSGDTATGNLIMSNNKYFRGLKTTGSSANLIGFNQSNEIVAGDSSSKFKISGSDLMFNNKKVWHEDNDGANSGLDADLLGGASHSLYARTDKETKFDKSIISGSNVYAKSSFIFGESYGNRLAALTTDSTGSIKVSNGSTVYHSFLGNGILQSQSYHDFIASSREVRIRFKLNSSDGGLGMYRNTDSKYLGFYDWNKKKRIGFISHETSSFHFDEPIYIGGRKLFMQGGTPSGSIPKGSLWIS